VKRGQVTVFVLAGFIIIIALALLFTAAAEINAKYFLAKKNKFISFDYNEGFARNQVDACIDGIVEETSYLMGYNAGYLSCLPNYAYAENGASDCVYVNSSSLPVMLDEDGVYFLSREEIEKRICSKLHVDLNTCFDKSNIEFGGVDVLSFDLGGDVASASEYCRAYVENKSIVVRTNYSVFISQGDFQTNVSGFTAEKQLPIWYLLQKAEEFSEFVRSSADENNTINLSVACIAHPDFSILADGEVVTFTYLPQVGSAQFVFQFAYKDYGLVGQC
jgi:hypothetical protein